MALGFVTLILKKYTDQNKSQNILEKITNRTLEQLNQQQDTNMDTH